MKRLLVAIVVARVAASPASGAVVIAKIYYDSPGSDRGSNASLNAEWVRIRNTGSTARTLTGWTLRDVARHVYRFGTLRLRAGYSVRVHTGSGSGTASHRIGARGWYVWNNTGDTAILKNRAGTTVDRCSSSGGSPGYTSC